MPPPSQWIGFSSLCLNTPWPHDGYDLQSLIQAGNLCSGKQQEEKVALAMCISLIMKVKIFFEDPSWFLLMSFWPELCGRCWVCVHAHRHKEWWENDVAFLWLYTGGRPRKWGLAIDTCLANRSDCYSQAYSSSGVRTGTCCFPLKSVLSLAEH